MSDNSTIRVLLVEDSFGDAELFIEGLEASEEGTFKIDHVTSLGEGLKSIHGEYDIVVTDLGLPDAKDLEAVERLRGERDGMPIVVLSNRSDLEACTRAIELGAQDYMVKGGLDLHEHGRIILKAIRREKLISSARRREENLEGATVGMSDRLSGPLKSLGFVMQRLERQVKQGSSKSRAVDTAEPVFDVMTKVLDRVGGFVDDMVLYAQAEAGQGEDSDLALEDVIAEALAGVGPIARAQGVEIDVVTGDAPTIRADRAQIVRAIAHLADNAVRYGAGPVKIATTSTEAGVQVTVEDHGKGIDPAAVDDLFVFLRKRAEGNANPGSGLGLPLAARVAERHGGTCTYAASPSGGSLLTFTIGQERVGAE